MNSLKEETQTSPNQGAASADELATLVVDDFEKELFDECGADPEPTGNKETRVSLGDVAWKEGREGRTRRTESRSPGTRSGSDSSHPCARRTRFERCHSTGGVAGERSARRMWGEGREAGEIRTTA